MTTPTREELIELCDRGVVAQRHWHDRDSSAAQRQLAECGALLKAECDFEMSSDPTSTDRTLWVRIIFKGFSYFEEGDWSSDLFYVPTAARLDEKSGTDWY